MALRIILSAQRETLCEERGSEMKVDSGGGELRDVHRERILFLHSVCSGQMFRGLGWSRRPGSHCERRVLRSDKSLGCCVEPRLVRFFRTHPTDPGPYQKCFV